MKNFILILVLITCSKNLSAQIKQTNWQWRTNESTETNVKPKAAINTTINAISAYDAIRLRIRIEDQDAASTTAPLLSIKDEIQYTTTPDEILSWVSVGKVNDGTVPFVMQGINAYVSQNSPTTSSQLGSTTSPFYQGVYMLTNTLTDGVNIYPASATEIEWCMKVTSSAIPGTKYFFREFGTTNTCDMVVAKLASLNMVGVLPVKYTSFNVSKDGKKIKLDWITALEENNDRFEVMRSNEGKTWKTLSVIKGHGTTNLTNSYKFYDENPLKGINYYIIKQFNIDGSFNVSEIKQVSVLENIKSNFIVSPNPTNGIITFSINNNYKNVEVTLTNVNGGIIFTDNIINLYSGAINKLKLQKVLIPGIYILNLKSIGFSEAVKVIIY